MPQTLQYILIAVAAIVLLAIVLKLFKVTFKTILKLALNAAAYYSGQLAMWLLYPLLELAVFAVEAVAFRLALKKPDAEFRFQIFQRGT